MSNVYKFSGPQGPPRKQPGTFGAISLDRPSTWMAYRSGLCNDCWAGCCTLPVEASAFDLIRLELTDEFEAGQSLKKTAKRLMDEGVVRSFNSRTGVFTLEQRHGRDCIFLHPETRQCTVYDKRPEVCRQFPKIGPRPGFCPALRK